MSTYYRHLSRVNFSVIATRDAVGVGSSCLGISRSLSQRGEFWPNLVFAVDRTRGLQFVIMQLADLYKDFFAVLRSSPHGQVALSHSLLPHNSQAVAVADILGVTCETSIDEKLKAPQGFYNQPYDLFHDLKLAFGRLIAQYPQNVPEYNEISSLFKFATDLLVREAERFGFTSRLGRKALQKDSNENSLHFQESWNDIASHAQGDAKPDVLDPVSVSNGGNDLGFNSPNGTSSESRQNIGEDEYLMQVSQGFQTISTELQDWNGETYWITAANGPMFLSMNNKAPMDPRDTAVAGSVHTVKLMPHNARAPESTLGFTSPLNPLFPQPDAPPTDLLSRFVHPNGHGTFSPLWLTGQDSYSSFAPTSASAGAVVGGEDAASVWADKAIQSVVRSHPSMTPKDEDASMRDDSEPESKEPQAEDVLATDFESIPSLLSEDLEALLKWTPYSFVDNDEFEAAKAGREAERQLVSQLLLELQDLQDERMSVYGEEPEIGDRERHVAFKSTKLLAGLVEEARSDDIALKLDTRLPVLMRNYAGALPAAPDPFLNGPPNSYGGQSMPPMSQRLQTIAGLRSRSRAPRR